MMIVSESTLSSLATDTPLGKDPNIEKAIENSLDFDPSIQVKRIREYDISIQLTENEKNQDKIISARDALNFVLKIFKMVGKGVKFIETALSVNDVWLDCVQGVVKQTKNFGTVGKFAIDVASLINIKKKSDLIGEETAVKDSLEKKQKKITCALTETAIKITRLAIKGIRVFFEKSNPLKDYLKRLSSGFSVILDVWAFKDMVSETKKLYTEFRDICTAQNTVKERLKRLDRGSDEELRLRIRQLFLAKVHMRHWVEEAVGNLLGYFSCFTGAITSVGIILVLSGPLFALASTAAVYLFMISVVFYLGTWMIDSIYFGVTDLHAKDPKGEVRARLERLSELNEAIQKIYKMAVIFPKTQAGKNEEGRDIETLENLLVTGLSDHFDIAGINPNDYDFGKKIEELKEEHSGNTEKLEQLEELKKHHVSLQLLNEKAKPLTHEDLKRVHKLDVKKLEDELIASLPTLKIERNEGTKQLADQTENINELKRRLNDIEAIFRRNLFASFCPQGRAKGVKLTEGLDDQAIMDLLKI